MCSKNNLRWIFGIVLMLGLQWPAAAGVMLGGTRVILGEKDREVSIPAKNTGTSPYVVGPAKFIVPLNRVVQQRAQTPATMALAPQQALQARPSGAIKGP